MILKYEIPSTDNLYRAVRAGFTSKGTSFGSWCRRDGTSPEKGRQILFGLYDGKDDFIKRVIEASGVVIVEGSDEGHK